MWNAIGASGATQALTREINSYFDSSMRAIFPMVMILKTRAVLSRLDLKARSTRSSVLKVIRSYRAAACWTENCAIATTSS
jgi:hypothetical protein